MALKMTIHSNFIVAAAAPRFADLSRLPPEALIATASGTAGDAQSHADLRCCSVRTRPLSG